MSGKENDVKKPGDVGSAPEPAIALIKVKLAKEHTHNGEPHKVGAEIEVSQRTKNWLIKHGVVEAPKA